MRIHKTHRHAAMYKRLLIVLLTVLASSVVLYFGLTGCGSTAADRIEATVIESPVIAPSVIPPRPRRPHDLEDRMDANGKVGW